MSDSAIRVALVSRASATLHGPGGLERHVDDLACQLLERGVAVTLITRPASRTGAEADWLRDERLTLKTIRYRTFPFAGRRGTTILDRNTAYLYFGFRAGRLAARLLSDGHVDLVHGHGASVLGAVLPAPTARVPLVLTPHGLEEFGGTDLVQTRLKRIAYRPLQTAVRRCARYATRILATDQALVSSTVTNLRVPESSVRVVPNAVDLGRCDALAGPAEGAKIRSVWNIPSVDRVFLSVGRVEKNKGFAVLAGALAQVCRDSEFRRWRWVIVGDGHYRSTLEQIVGKLGLQDRTLFAGATTDRELHAWYEAATVFVHPTLYEGSSIVTLEAMAHSRPVVASRVGGLPDKVLPGVTGWLASPGDAGDLGHALTEVLKLEEHLPRMGEAGRALVERCFSWPSVTERLLSHYDDVLAECASLRASR